MSQQSSYKFFILTLVFSTSCVSNKTVIKKSQLSSQQIQKLERGNQFMKSNHFLKAGQIYDSLSYSLKDSSAQILALYNAGIAYKSAGKCEQSLNRFRSVLKKSLKKFSRFKARALLEASFVYECLGQEDLSLSSLKDLERVLGELSFPSREILYPARLSIAWAKNGNTKQAEVYQSLSLNNLLEYQKNFKNKDQLKEEISRLFYLMGKSFDNKKTLKPQSFISSFFYHQLFLLQSLFLKNEPWSNLAQKELTTLFDTLFYILSESKQAQKYKKTLESAFKAGSSMIENEQNSEWLSFYKKQSKRILNLYEYS